MVATTPHKSTKKSRFLPDDTRERRLEIINSLKEGNRVFCEKLNQFGTYIGIQDSSMPSAWVLFDGKSYEEPISPLDLTKQPDWKKGDKVIYGLLNKVGVVVEVTGLHTVIEFDSVKDWHASHSESHYIKLEAETEAGTEAKSLAPVFNSEIKVGDEATAELPDEIYKVVHVEEGQASIRRLDSPNPNNAPQVRQLPLWHLSKVEAPPWDKKVEQTTLQELLDGNARAVPSPLVESIEGANNWINLFSGQSLNSQDYEVSWAKAPVQSTSNSFDIPEDFDGEALSREEVEKLIEKIVETSESIKSLALFAKNFTRYALVVIDAREGYKAYDCDSMSQFLEAYSHLFKKAYSSLQKEWQAGRLEHDLDLKIGTLPETQARELYPLKDNLEDCLNAWEKACEVAESQNRRVKSADIGAAVREIAQLPEPPKKIRTKCSWVAGPNAARHYRVKIFESEINLHDTYDAAARMIIDFAEARSQAPEGLIVEGLIGALGEVLGVSNAGAVAAAVDFLKRGAAING